MPVIKVNNSSFAKGIQRVLLTDDQIFDLVILSTCNNGNPEIASHLITFTDHLLASPPKKNLHLSHIDSDRMAILEEDSQPSSEQLAWSMAEQTYRRLAATIQTTITLALYDLGLVDSGINELHTATLAQEQSAQTHLIQNKVGCAQFTFFDAEKYRAGVKTWYKPARFGRGGKLESHSGWGCEPPLKTDAAVNN
ncbi:hypothetical protein G3570_03405 [Balneolaceae bacterium YR4-1]|uniref:Uncharacterized protein n=1 Tax=Halalkalibaculum roseum TaxID=2709311 RepID=A0A6M1T5T3_9BACT|nr:hypothetical protein [Halalkalibaculum roseum]NGP75663.1 hypothetical protein [Halalkalibaculum roseum]